ncbi:BRO-N domain-containing protein [Morganella morganii]|uniref:BRO-N domain-containing protein n=1 Tax=Morganella morganii TaxID=582 RepID=UPI000DCB5DF6|nr:BRO family protein [Morganella morganii]RAX26887.1 antirepressor protein [Morganella morganii]HCT7997066.1 antirepressor protein [Morganella morganii]
MKNKNMAVIGQGFAHPEISQSDISVIRFEGVQVRIIKANNEPWFIFKDVCKALGISKYRDAFSRLDADERRAVKVDTLGGKQAVSACSESGFYKTIARSRKATTPGTFAHRFSNWVFRDVIPSIRKTGAYGVPFGLLNDFTRRSNEYLKVSSQRGRDLQSCKAEKISLETEEKQLWDKYQPQLPAMTGEEPQ